MRNPHSSWYRLIIRSLPVVFLTGVGISLLGAYLRSRWWINIGVCVFLAGAAIWGLANGGFLLWLFVHAARKCGIQDVAAHPIKSVAFLVFTIFLIATGICFSWLALNGFLAK
jgi:hypothetical protein